MKYIKIRFTVMMVLVIVAILSGCREENASAESQGITSQDSYSESQETALAPPLIYPESQEIDSELGQIAYCYVHSMDFHSFPWEFMEYVGLDNFGNWTNERSDTLPPDANDGCTFDVSILSFIQYFNVPKEKFHELYYNTYIYYTDEHNVELLYSGDSEKIEEYYRDIDAVNERHKVKTAILTFKQNLYMMIPESIREDKYSGCTIREISIAEIIEAGNISREKVEDMLLTVNSQTDVELNVDIDMIFSMEIIEEDPVKVDDLIIKTSFKNELANK